MVHVPKERTFPRGGREDRPDGPKLKFPDWCKHKSKDVDNKRNSKSRIKPWVKRHVQIKTDSEEMEARSRKTKGDRGMKLYTGSLRYKAIAEGMLILGTINRIKPYELGISLPGSCIGYVPITNISGCYTNVLNANSGAYRLYDMFHIGQHVITKVVKNEVLDGREKNKIFLSLAPEVIHSDCTAEDVLKGTVFTAAVASVQEKGYVMDLGIKSVRAFLTKENSENFEKIWNKGNELGIGQLVRCLVTNVTTADLLTTIVLTADPKLVANTSANTTGARLQGLLPGMHFKVTVVRHVYPSGVQVRLSDNVIGYVPPNHLSKNFKSPKEFEVDRVHSAKVLYISPSGAIFFTLKNTICPAHPPVSPFNAIKAGFTTDSAIVWDVSETGLTVKLGKKNDSSALLKGIIPLSHVRRKLKVPVEADSESNLSEQLLNEFPIGSTVTCRIIDYCYMDQYYVCTMDEDLLKEKYIHPSTLQVGLVVQATVKEISPKGVVMALGKKSPVSGFLPFLHASNVPLRHPGKKFNIGQTCTVKVLSVDHNILLTMKQALIESNNMLMKFDNAVVGRKYPGTVIIVNQTGILVEFYSNYTSWIPRKKLGVSNMPTQDDLKEIFHVGHLVNCIVVGKSQNTCKLFLSLVHMPMEVSPHEDDGKVQVANYQYNTVEANVTKTKKKTTKKSTENGVVASDPIIREEVNEISCRDKGGMKRKKQSCDPKDLGKGKKKKKQTIESAQFEVEDNGVAAFKSSKKEKKSTIKNVCFQDMFKAKKK